MPQGLWHEFKLWGWNFWKCYNIQNVHQGFNHLRTNMQVRLVCNGFANNIDYIWWVPEISFFPSYANFKFTIQWFYFILAVINLFYQPPTLCMTGFYYKKMRLKDCLEHMSCYPSTSKSAPARCCNVISVIWTIKRPVVSPTL